MMYVAGPSRGEGGPRLQVHDAVRLSPSSKEEKRSEWGGLGTVTPRAEATPASVQGGTGRHTDTRTRVPDRRALLGTPRAEGVPRGRVAPASAVWAHRPQRTPARASPHASVWACGPLCGAAAPSCGHGQRGRWPAWPQALEGTANLQARQPWGQPTGLWPGAAVHPWRGLSAARGAGAARTAPHPGCARHLRVESRVPSRARPAPPGPRGDLRVQPGAGTPAWLPCSGRASEWGAPFAGVSTSPVFLMGPVGGPERWRGPWLVSAGMGEAHGHGRVHTHRWGPRATRGLGVSSTAIAMWAAANHSGRFAPAPRGSRFCTHLVPRAYASEPQPRHGAPGSTRGHAAHRTAAVGGRPEGKGGWGWPGSQP